MVGLVWSLPLRSEDVKLYYQKYGRVDVSLCLGFPRATPGDTNEGAEEFVRFAAESESS